MAEQTLPEGTDSIVSDAEMAGSDRGFAGTPGGGTSDAGSRLATSPSATPDPGGGVREALRTSSDKLRTTASDKALGLLGQGIERSSDALTNVSALIADTATSLDERLGAQYGDYARTAAESIERAASSLAGKDPEELFEDARSLVRKSPGVALAGAAILGFALVRVVKSGLDSDSGRSGSGGKGGAS